MAQSYNKNTLRNPDGTEAIIDNVSGITFKTSALLSANGTVNTGWISYGQYMSASIVVFSDTAGSLKYEYSADGGTTILDSITTTFATLNDFRVAVIPLGKGTHLKLTYTNGATAQTKFYLSVSLGLDLVESMGSIFTPININNIASITKTFLQVPDSNLQTALYDFVTRTGNSLNVNNTNNITGFGLESTQLLVKSNTDKLNVNLDTRASETTLSVLNTKVTTTANGIKVDGSAIIQPISATVLPLPTGASTSALQTTGNTSLSSIDTKLTNVATNTLQTVGNTSLSNIDSKTPLLGQALITTSSPVVLPASQITALTPSPAITGFNLESTQLLVKAKTDNLDVALSTRLKPSDTLTKVATVDTITNTVTVKADTFANQTNAFKVDGSGVTQPVSGTVIANAGINLNTSLLATEISLNTLLKPTSTLNAVTTLGGITNALPTGSNIIGKIGIDQTTQGTTNFVTNNNTQINGNAISTNNGLTNTGTQRIVLANRVESLLGGIAINDLAITSGQRIKSLLFTNNSASVIYLQIFNKASALVLNEVPLNGLIIRVPANSTLDKNTGDFSEAGILYGANIRIGLSSTFGTYTAITPTNTSINVITVA